MSFQATLDLEEVSINGQLNVWIFPRPAYASVSSPKKILKEKKMMMVMMPFTSSKLEMADFSRSFFGKENCTSCIVWTVQMYSRAPKMKLISQFPLCLLF